MSRFRWKADGEWDDDGENSLFYRQQQVEPGWVGSFSPADPSPQVAWLAMTVTNIGSWRAVAAGGTCRRNLSLLWPESWAVVCLHHQANDESIGVILTEFHSDFIRPSFPGRQYPFIKQIETLPSGAYYLTLVINPRGAQDLLLDNRQGRRRHRGQWSPKTYRIKMVHDSWWWCDTLLMITEWKRPCIDRLFKQWHDSRVQLTCPQNNVPAASASTTTGRLKKPTAKRHTIHYTVNNNKIINLRMKEKLALSETQRQIQPNNLNLIILILRLPPRTSI